METTVYSLLLHFSNIHPLATNIHYGVGLRNYSKAYPSFVYAIYVLIMVPISFFYACVKLNE